MKLTKDQAQTRHALQRAQERYEVNFTPGDLKHIRTLIQKGYSRYLKKCTNRVTEHMVVYQDRDFRVAYDKSRNQICSFLPLED